MLNRPNDFKTAEIYNSTFCVSIQKKLNVNKIIVVTVKVTINIYQSQLVKYHGLGHS